MRCPPASRKPPSFNERIEIRYHQRRFVDPGRLGHRHFHHRVLAQRVSSGTAVMLLNALPPVPRLIVDQTR